MTVHGDIAFQAESWQAVWDALFEGVDMQQFYDLPQCQDMTGKELALERVKQLREANERLEEISGELYGKGFQIAGWHQNGDLEPLDSWFEENQWGPVS